jgi:hypothetical protein
VRVVSKTTLRIVRNHIDLILNTLSNENNLWRHNIRRAESKEVGDIRAQPSVYVVEVCRSKPSCTIPERVRRLCV